MAKSQKIDLEILSGLTYHSTKKYPQILQKCFFDWSIDIFLSLIDYIKFSIETQWRLVTAVCKICPKYTKGIIVILHPHCVTNWPHVTAEKKETVPWAVNAKLWMQFMTVVSLYQSHNLLCVDLKSLNHKQYSHEKTLSRPLKWTLDVTPNLKWSVVRCTTPYSNISKKCLLCLYEKLVIITNPRQHELLNKQSELFCKCRHENNYLLS